MKINTFKRTIAASAFGLAVLLGTSAAADAQTTDQQQQKTQKQRAKIEDQQIKSDQRKEQLRLKNMPKSDVNSDNKRFRINRNGTFYQLDNRAAEMLKQAVNAGYQEGYRAGRDDRYNRRTSGFNNSSVYKKATYGYQKFVDSSHYQYYFKQGFEHGYDDGFNSRYENGTNNNGSINILDTILQKILIFEQV